MLFLLRERATSDSSKDIEVVIRDSGVRESIGIASAHVVNSHGLYSYQSVEAVAAFYSKSVAAPAISMTAMDGHEFFSRFSTVSINPLFRGRETTASVEGGGLTMTNRPTRNDLTRVSERSVFTLHSSAPVSCCRDPLSVIPRLWRLLYPD